MPLICLTMALLTSLTDLKLPVVMPYVMPAILKRKKRIGMRPLRSNDPTRVCPSLERTPAKKPMARMAI